MLPTDTWYTQPTFLFGRPRLFFGGNLFLFSKLPRRVVRGLASHVASFGKILTFC
jgi:hypothetical protein